MDDHTLNRIADLRNKVDHYTPDLSGGRDRSVDNDVRRCIDLAEQVGPGYRDAILTVCEEWMGFVSRQIEADREFDAWTTEQMYAARAAERAS